MTSSSKLVMCVFDPPWWRVDRWFGWWVAFVVWRVLFYVAPGSAALRRWRARGTVEITGLGRGKAPVVCRFVEEPRA